MNKPAMTPEQRAARIESARALIINALSKRPHSRQELRSLVPTNKNETTTILAELHSAYRIMYNQTDKTVELYRVAQGWSA